MPEDQWPPGHKDLSVIEQGAQLRRIVAAELLDFFFERLKFQLHERGSPLQIIKLFRGQDDLLLVARRVEAMVQFFNTDDGQNLVTGYKRAVSILQIEEERDHRRYIGPPQPELYVRDEERALAQAIEEASQEMAAATEREDFVGAMTAVAKLRPAVDAFFDEVLVNVDDPDLRDNRLKLLHQIRLLRWRWRVFLAPRDKIPH